jgi:hypothetical protein
MKHLLLRTVLSSDRPVRVPVLENTYSCRSGRYAQSSLRGMLRLIKAPGVKPFDCHSPRLLVLVPFVKLREDREGHTTALIIVSRVTCPPVQGYHGGSCPCLLGPV